MTHEVNLCMTVCFLVGTGVKKQGLRRECCIFCWGWGSELQSATTL